VPDRPDPWAGTWEGARQAQQQAWARTTPDERLRWLEEALVFASDAGALAGDRRRRAETARRWADA
jgi:hypothetical protein